MPIVDALLGLELSVQLVHVDCDIAEVLPREFGDVTLKDETGVLP